MEGSELQTSQERVGVVFTPEFDQYPHGAQAKIRIDVALKANNVPSAENSRAKISLTSVIDRSGSMAGSKIQLACRTNQYFADRLQDMDKLGVLSFDNEVIEELPLTALDGNGKLAAQTAISKIRARGSTNLSGGLLQGIKQQSNGKTDAGALRRVFLFTDGQANCGITNIEELQAEVLKACDKSVPIVVYTFGIGGDVDPNFLKKLADAGNGMYSFIESADQIAMAFGTALGTLLSTLASQIKVTFKPIGGATIKAVRCGSSQVVRADDGSYELHITDLIAEETKNMLVDVVVPACDAEVEQPVLKVAINYTDALSGQACDLSQTFHGKRTNISECTGSPNEQVQVTELRLGTAEFIERATEAAQRRDYDSALAQLQQASHLLSIRGPTSTVVANAIENLSSAVTEVHHSVRQVRRGGDSARTMATGTGWQVAQTLSSQRSTRTDSHYGRAYSTTSQIASAREVTEAVTIPGLPASSEAGSAPMQSALAQPASTTTASCNRPASSPSAAGPAAATQDVAAPELTG